MCNDVSIGNRIRKRIFNGVNSRGEECTEWNRSLTSMEKEKGKAKGLG